MNVKHPLIITLIFLSCHEKGHDNKEFSHENSKSRLESRITHDPLSRTLALNATGGAAKHAEILGNAGEWNCKSNKHGIEKTSVLAPTLLSNLHGKCRRIPAKNGVGVRRYNRMVLLFTYFGEETKVFNAMLPKNSVKFKQSKVFLDFSEFYVAYLYPLKMSENF